MKHSKQISIWLLTTCFLVYLVILVGGLTRLTKSGLSIVEWKPISGILPPLNKTQWNQEFNQYKQYPEYKKQNKKITLKEYKAIYWWEYIHRLLARLIGIAFFIPFFIFTLQNKLSKTIIWKSTIVLFLIGLQGFIGWYMVKSGLSGKPHVSHFRLALHLGLALLIFAILYWECLNLKYTKIEHKFKKFKMLFLVFIILLVLQTIYGAFSAGLKVGYLHNTFPLMSEEFIPEFLISKQQTFWESITENRSMIQWIHRYLGMLLLAYGAYIFVTFYNKNNYFYPHQSFFLYVWFFCLFLQFILGVVTLILAVPTFLGSLHQNVGFFLLVSSLHFYHSLTHYKDAM